jgi:hypothetical protein
MRLLALFAIAALPCATQAQINEVLPGASAYFDAAYGGIGAAIGAGVGADKWTRIDLRPRVSALPNGRFGIGVSLR